LRDNAAQVAPGLNVGLGKDHTLFALINGHLQFRTKRRPRLRLRAAAVEAVAEAPAE
jgi:large subunit ribosomal protein L27